MADEPKPTSEWTRKRTVRKIRRETLIKPRDAYFDLLLSGLQRRQIVNRTKKSPSAVRGAVDQALARRRLDAPEEYASLRVARVTKALRCADVSLKEGGLDGDRAVRESRAGAEPLPWRPCRPDATRSAGGAGGHRTDTAACAYAFAG